MVGVKRARDEPRFAGSEKQTRCKVAALPEKVPWEPSYEETKEVMAKHFVPEDVDELGKAKTADQDSSWEYDALDTTDDEDLEPRFRVGDTVRVWAQPVRPGNTSPKPERPKNFLMKTTFRIVGILDAEQLEYAYRVDSEDILFMDSDGDEGDASDPESSEDGVKDKAVDEVKEPGAKLERHGCQVIEVLDDDTIGTLTEDEMDQTQDTPARAGVVASDYNDVSSTTEGACSRWMYQLKCCGSKTLWTYFRLCSENRLVFMPELMGDGDDNDGINSHHEEDEAWWT